MAGTFTLYEKGYLSGGIELVYNYTNQLNYKLRYGAQMQVPETSVNLHVPDDGDAQPITAIDRDRTFYFNLHILSDASNDEVLDALSRLLRMADGANQPGLRHHILGDSGEHFLRTQLEDSTNYTDHSIRWGFVDVNEALFTSGAVLNEMAQDVVVALRLAPYGEGSPIILHNDLSNGDFLVESSTSGLAQGWSAINTPTLTLAVDPHLVNGVCQKVVTDASSSEGVISPTVTASTSSDLCAFGWIYVEAGGDPVSFRLEDASNNNIHEVKTTDSGIMSLTDRFGNTWYRMEVLGSNTVAANARLRIQRTAADASTATTFYVDACYLQVGTQTVPAGGWVSESNTIRNRADETNTTMGDRNWLDVALVPGDAPAVIKIEGTSEGDAIIDDFMFASMTDTAHLAVDQAHWLESEDYHSRTANNGTWSTISAATWSGGDAERFTANAAGGNGSISWRFQGDAARALASQARSVYAQMTASNSAVTANLDDATDYQTSILQTGFDANVFALNVGVHNAMGAFPPTDELVGTNVPSVLVTLEFSGVPDTATFDIDGLWLFPTSNDDLSIVALDSQLNPEAFYIDGKNRAITTDVGGIDEEALSSRNFVVQPGLLTTRWLLLNFESNPGQVSDIDYYREYNVTVWPRTRQMLGVL